MVLLVMDMLAFLSSFFSVDWLYGVMLMLRRSFSSVFFLMSLPCDDCLGWNQMPDSSG
jgi:hypothetical protein